MYFKKVTFSICCFKQQHQALFYECSAVTGCNVEELMNHLAGYCITFFYCTLFFMKILNNIYILLPIIPLCFLYFFSHFLSRYLLHMYVQKTVVSG